MEKLVENLVGKSMGKLVEKLVEYSVKYQWKNWWKKLVGQVGGSVYSGCHKLSENIWFVWSKRSYYGDKEVYDSCPRTDNGT